MAKINLRPWRAEVRQQRQKEYVSFLALVALAAVALWYGVSNFYADSSSSQNARNGYLENEIAILDKKIEEIRELREKREQMLDRMQLIQDLQGNRPVIVRTFDELARVLPDEVFFESLKVAGKTATLKGKANSNSQVSQLMRRFDQSLWFANPNLLNVQAHKNKYNDFNMLVELSQPKKEEVQ